MLLSFILILMALLGAPLFLVIAASAVSGFISENMSISLVILELNRLAETPILVTIPLFTFAGYLFGESNTPHRLVRLTRAAFGWMPAGLAIVTLVVSSIFTALTGASGVTIIALGALLFPALIEEKYPEDFSLGLVTTSGSMGILFIPAIPLILYGIVAQTSIDKMFAAGLLPGVLMLVLVSIYSIVKSRGMRTTTYSFSKKELWLAVREAKWEIPIPILILGGIYSGWFAISEAASITAILAFVVEVFIYKEIPLDKLLKIMHKSMTLVGGILIIMGVSFASTNYMIDQEIPTKLFTLVRGFITNKITFLIILNVFLLALGCVLDVFSAVVLVVPLVLPIATSYGIDPVHLGIIFLANLQIGYSTPPVGMNLFIASYRFEKPVLQLYRVTLPFLLLLLIVVLVITYVPEISLFLARMVQ